MSACVCVCMRVCVCVSGGGFVNHILFWNNMVKNGTKLDAKGLLHEAIERDLGGMEQLEAVFKDKATKLFGSGWCWLVWTASSTSPVGGSLSVETTSNQVTFHVYMYPRLSLCLDMCRHARVCTHTHTRTRMRVSVHMYISINALDVCMPFCMYTCMNIIHTIHEHVCPCSKHTQTHINICIDALRENAVSLVFPAHTITPPSPHRKHTNTQTHTRRHTHKYT